MGQIFTRSSALLLCLTLARAAHAATPPEVGVWQAVDDKSGKPTSLVQTYLESGKLFAKVIKVLRTDVPPDPKCVKCKGEDKDKPVMGLVIIRDLTNQGDAWTGGTILDPDNGVRYSCKVTLDGDKLEIRGYVGVALFGRTQTWQRAAAPKDMGSGGSGPAPTPAPATNTP